MRTPRAGNQMPLVLHQTTDCEEGAEQEDTSNKTAELMVSTTNLDLCGRAAEPVDPDTSDKEDRTGDDHNLLRAVCLLCGIIEHNEFSDAIMLACGSECMGTIALKRVMIWRWGLLCHPRRLLDPTIPMYYEPPRKRYSHTDGPGHQSLDSPPKEA